MTLIPGAQTVWSRESWQHPSYPVFGPLDNPKDNDVIVIHYTAADDLIDGDPGEYASDLPQYMRNMQKSYVLNRGYSLGYLWAVDWLGGIWQIRGWEYQSAANASHNTHTWPILVLVDGDDAATPEAVRSVQLIGAEAERRAGRPQRVMGHGQLKVETGVGTATSCPGRGLQAQVRNGTFNPKGPDPVQPNIPEDDDMPKHMYIAKPPVERPGQPWLLYADTDIREANSFDLQLGLPVHDFNSVNAEWRVGQYDKDLARARRDT